MTLPTREPLWHAGYLRLSLLAEARVLFGWHARQLSDVTNESLLTRIRTEIAARTGKERPQ